MRSKNFSFTPVPQHGWDQSRDFTPLALESALLTEGYLCFFHEGAETRRCLFLLEFLIEAKTRLLAHFGSSQFTAKLVLPLSAGNFEIERGGERVSLREAATTILSAEYTDFLADFLAFESELRREMASCFPKMASSWEFAMVFGQNVPPRA